MSGLSISDGSGNALRRSAGVRLVNSQRGSRVSRRTQQYRVHRRETVDDTFTAIVHAHRHTSACGKRHDAVLDTVVAASRPISEEKALRIAKQLHASKY